MKPNGARSYASNGTSKVVRSEGPKDGPSKEDLKSNIIAENVPVKILKKDITKAEVIVEEDEDGAK